MTYLCLSVAAAGLGFLIGSNVAFKRGVRIGRALEQDGAKAKRDARMLKLWSDIFNEEPRNRTGHFKECICWRCEIEHVTDSLVGSATYRGDE